MIIRILKNYKVISLKQSLVREGGGCLELFEDRDLSFLCVVQRKNYILPISLSLLSIGMRGGERFWLNGSQLSFVCGTEHKMRPKKTAINLRQFLSNYIIGCKE
jgi:hypothetical protein